MTVDTMSPRSIDEIGMAVGVIGAAQDDILRSLSALAGEIRDAGRSAKTVNYQIGLRVKAGSGVIYGVSGYNNNGAARHIQFIDWHDDNIPPNNTTGDKIIWEISGVATATGFTQDFGPKGLRFEDGLWIVSSSTTQLLTQSAADMLCWARYL